MPLDVGRVLGIVGAASVLPLEITGVGDVSIGRTLGPAALSQYPSGRTLGAGVRPGGVGA